MKADRVRLVTLFNVALTHDTFQPLVVGTDKLCTKQQAFQYPTPLLLCLDVFPPGAGKFVNGRCCGRIPRQLSGPSAFTGALCPEKVLHPLPVLAKSRHIVCLICDTVVQPPYDIVMGGRRSYGLITESLYEVAEGQYLALEGFASNTLGR